MQMRKELNGTVGRVVGKNRHLVSFEYKFRKDMILNKFTATKIE